MSVKPCSMWMVWFIFYSWAPLIFWSTNMWLSLLVYITVLVYSTLSGVFAFGFSPELFHCVINSSWQLFLICNYLAEIHWFTNWNTDRKLVNCELNKKKKPLFRPTIGKFRRGAIEYVVCLGLEPRTTSCTRLANRSLSWAWTSNVQTSSIPNQL